MGTGLADGLIGFFLNYYTLAFLLGLDILAWIYLIKRRNLDEVHGKIALGLALVLTLLIILILALALAFSKAHPGGEPTPRTIGHVIASLLTI